MNRTDAIIAIDDAAESLEKASKILNDLGCTYGMSARIAALVAALDELRVDVAQCSLLVEE